MTTLLITTADIAAIESISLNTDFNKKIRPHIVKAQELDVRPLIGETFWLAIVANPATYANLLAPFQYTYNGKLREHPGLKSVIIEYTLARYKSDANIHDTPFGLMQKENPYSSPVSDKKIARAEAKMISGAEAYWVRVRAYLNRNKSTYPLWEGCSRAKRTTGSGIEILKVSRQCR